MAVQMSQGQSRSLSEFIPGRVVYISGTTPNDGSEMVINIINHDDITNQDNIALQFATRFNQNSIVCNSCIGGVWGKEERHGIPFGSNQSFSIAIIYQLPCYEIAVNGQHFTQYYHRLPFKNNVTIEVTPSYEIVNYC